MYIVYNTELLGDINQYSFFSVDESLFAHSNNKTNMDFRHHRQYK